MQEEIERLLSKSGLFSQAKIMWNFVKAGCNFVPLAMYTLLISECRTMLGLKPFINLA